MNRRTWTVAWRHARRLLGKQRQLHGEAALLDMAQLELAGRRLPLTDQAAAAHCWITRRYDAPAEVARRARTKRFYALADLCRDRWEREERELAASARPITSQRQEQATT